jgi:hypothetical protein
MISVSTYLSSALTGLIHDGRAIHNKNVSRDAAVSSGWYMQKERRHLLCSSGRIDPISGPTKHSIIWFGAGSAQSSDSDPKPQVRVHMIVITTCTRTCQVVADPDGVENNSLKRVLSEVLPLRRFIHVDGYSLAASGGLTRWH